MIVPGLCQLNPGVVVEAVESRHLAPETLATYNLVIITGGSIEEEVHLYILILLHSKSIFKTVLCSARTSSPQLQENRKFPSFL